jgi:hypothetical protein
MTDKTLERIWRRTDMYVDRSDGQDTVAVELLSEGQRFAVVATGPEHMSITQMTDALRAALFYLLRDGNADPGAMAGIGARVIAPGELTPVGGVDKKDLQ